MTKSIDLSILRLIDDKYISQATISTRRFESRLTNLLEDKSVPLVGWSESDIERSLMYFSSMDSNNRGETSYIGEREGLVLSNMVHRRHFGFTHGMGRSGDLMAIQPKAPGSSSLVRLTTALVLNYMRVACGLKGLSACVLYPMATGMSLSMCFQYMNRIYNKNVIIWSRIDQNSCVKSMQGFTVIVVPQIFNKRFRTDKNTVEALLQQRKNEILCVVTTTSCFAPRSPDCIEEIAILCDEYGVGHVINNAYGLQCDSICDNINKGCAKGRVDFVVQSLDKNFMVPVAGSVIASPSAEHIAALSSYYPGRSSISHIIDLYITLLNVGIEKFKALRKNRKELFNKTASNIASAMCEYSTNRISVSFIFTTCQSRTGKPAIRYLSDTPPSNGTPPFNADAGQISIEIAVKQLADKAPAFETSGRETMGSYIFNRGISGARCIHFENKPATGDNTETILIPELENIYMYHHLDKNKLSNFGSHGIFPDQIFGQGLGYLVFAICLLTTEDDVQKLLRMLHRRV